MIWRVLQLLVKWVSFLVIPWQIYWIIVLWADWINWLAWLSLVLGCLLIYMRFVEPNLIVIKREKFSYKQKRELADGQFWTDDVYTWRVILISDLHLGVFKGENFLQKVLRKIAGENPDLVVIPGDLINDPSSKELSEMLKPLGKVSCPVLVVTGNHDARKPGMYESEMVREAARMAGLITIDNDSFLVEKGDRQLEIFGLSDLLEGKIQYEVLTRARPDRTNLLLAHNPDTAYFLDESLAGKFPLILSGHTHAGQIKIPFLYKLVIPSKYKFVSGWYDVRGKKVFVSSGLGEVILPMRLGVKPEIVVVDLLV